jgi:hypothetical protein
MEPCSKGSVYVRERKLEISKRRSIPCRKRTFRKAIASAPH